MSSQDDASDDGWLQAAPGGDGRSMQGRLARGLTWTVVDTWGRQLLNLGVFVVLANLLQPVDFGLVALAAVFVAFAQVFVDQGLGDALIQRPELTRRHLDTAFWVAIATGLVLTTMGLVAAIPIAAVLHQPELQPIIQALSLTFVLAAMNSIQVALLRRMLSFRSLAIRSLVANSAGGAVGIALAVAGFGPWALVGQQMATALAAVLTLWWVLPWRPSRRVSREHFRELIGFGLNVVGNDVATFLTRNTDNLLIGAFLGTVPLGLYAVGYQILGSSQTLLLGISRRAAFPALSRLQADEGRIQRAYLKLTRISNALVVPAYVGLALVAPELVDTVFGTRWRDSGPVASVLFAIGPVLSLQAFSGSLFFSVGHPEVAFRFRVITMVTMVAGFVVAVPYGIVAVAAAFTVSQYLLLPLNLYWQRRYAGIETSGFLRQLRGIALATAALVVAVLGVRLAVRASVSEAMLLILEVVLGAAAYVVVLGAADRGLVRELLDVATHAVPGAGRVRTRLSAAERASGPGEAGAATVRMEQLMAADEDRPFIA